METIVYWFYCDEKRVGFVYEKHESHFLVWNAFVKEPKLLRKEHKDVFFTNVKVPLLIKRPHKINELTKEFVKRGLKTKVPLVYGRFVPLLI